MNVALVALDASVHVSGPKGDRIIQMQDFHRLPGDQPDKDTILDKNELITGVSIPATNLTHNHYLKVRDRSSYAFALVSVAAGLTLDGKTIRAARLAMGGVAHKPWRLKEAEQSLQGKQVSVEAFQQAADIAMRGARGYGDNDFKLKLAPNTIVEALKIASRI
jgi:xanthine dehydrogenase YagS FAD-binding subunit